MIINYNRPPVTKYEIRLSYENEVRVLTLSSTGVEYGLSNEGTNNFLQVFTQKGN